MWHERERVGQLPDGAGERRVGLRYFELFLDDPAFWQVFGNTLVLGTLTPLICFPLPIVLALLVMAVTLCPFPNIVAQSFSNESAIRASR